MKTEVKAAAIKVSKKDLEMIPTIGGEARHCSIHANNTWSCFYRRSRRSIIYQRWFLYKIKFF